MSFYFIFDETCLDYIIEIFTLLIAEMGFFCPKTFVPSFRFMISDYGGTLNNYLKLQWYSLSRGNNLYISFL